MLRDTGCTPALCTCLFSSLNCALVVTNALLFISFPNKTFSGNVYKQQEMEIDKLINDV
jgi:hypothetical protein